MIKDSLAVNTETISQHRNDLVIEAREFIDYGVVRLASLCLRLRRLLKKGVASHSEVFRRTGRGATQPRPRGERRGKRDDARRRETTRDKRQE